jgi:hypothetical protein
LRWPWPSLGSISSGVAVLRLVSLAVLGILAGSFPVPARAQDIVVDWESKRVVVAPPEIQKGNPVKVQVIKVNDILFEYTVIVQVTTDSFDDFSLLATLLKLPSAGSKGPGTTCANELNDALARAKAVRDQLESPGGPFNPEAAPGQYISISLKTTQDAWNGPLRQDVSKLQDDVAKLGSCTDNDSKKFVDEIYPPIKTAIAAIQKKIDAHHTAEGEAPAPKADVASVTITVHEKFKGKDTAGSPFTQTLKFSSVLTLSAGVLLSQLQDLSYVRRTVPTSSGTMDVLGVDGASTLTPYFVGLLNYRFPGLSWDKAGIYISSGPTIRLTSSNSNTASFGYFGGLSLSFWHRLYLTPGVHVGQFADLPAGLSLGQAIPANFGQIQPVKRWTARFGFGITYKTLSLGSLLGSSKSNAKTPTATNPAPAPSPKPKPETQAPPQTP